jgi:hypothetical protein
VLGSDTFDWVTSVTLDANAPSWLPSGTENQLIGVVVLKIPEELG